MKIALRATLPSDEQILPDYVMEQLTHSSLYALYALYATLLLIMFASGYNSGRRAKNFLNFPFAWMLQGEAEF